MGKKRTMREYTVTVAVVNPTFLVALGEPATYLKKVTVKAYSHEQAVELATAPDAVTILTSTFIDALSPTRTAAPGGLL